MIPNRSNVWTSIGTVAASALSVYAWLYSIGLVPLFTFVTGSFFTLLTQERFENKRRKQEFDRKMTESVYGPLHQELSAFRDDLTNFESSTTPTDRNSTLANFMKDYRYGLAEAEIRHSIEELRKRLLPYASLYSEVRNMTQSYVEQALNEGQIDHFIVFRVVGSRHEVLDQFNMIDAIFKDKTPMQFFTEQQRSYRNTSAVVIIGTRPEGHGEPYSNEHILEQISRDVLERLREDPTVKEQRAERSRLIEECTSLLTMIRKEITLS